MLAEVVGVDSLGKWELLDARGPFDGPRVSVYAGVLNNPVFWRRLKRDSNNSDGAAGTGTDTGT